MRFLLDTNVLLWASLRPERLKQNIRTLVRDENNQICVSAVSAWEISTKVRIGKLPEAADFEANFLTYMRGAGYEMLPITTEIALRSARLQGDHRDPFDRIVAAHALAEDIAVISPDTQLDSFGVRRIW